MEKFLNKKVEIDTCLGGLSGSRYYYRGVVTSFNDEFLCLDNNRYVAKKFILMIKIK